MNDLPSPHAEDDYAHLPFGDNVYVRRLADAERCLTDLHFAVPAVEAERQALLGRTSAIFSRMSETQVSLVVACRFEWRDCGSLSARISAATSR